MRCPTLAELPPPPSGKRGWPWTAESLQLPDSMPQGHPWPRITIVTPSYNQGHFIEETIRSVLLQGYPNLEYVMMDGGSTDASVEIIRKYEKHLSYWVAKPDDGQAAAIARGFNHASGNILAWLNSDDVYFPKALLRVGEFFTKHPNFEMLMGAFAYIDERSCILRCFESPTPKTWFLRRGKLYFGQQSIFFRRKSYERAGGLDTSLCFLLDTELWLRMILVHHVNCAAISDLLGCFRWHKHMKSIHYEGRKTEEIRLVWSRYMDKNSRLDVIVANAIFRLIQVGNGRYLRSSLRSLALRGKSIGERGRW